MAQLFPLLWEQRHHGLPAQVREGLKRWRDRWKNGTEEQQSWPRCPQHPSPFSPLEVKALSVGSMAPRTASSLVSHMEPDQKPVKWSETEEEALGLTPEPISGQSSAWHLGQGMACDLRRGQAPPGRIPAVGVFCPVCDFWAFQCPFASTHLVARNHQQCLQVYADPSPWPNWSCPTESGFICSSTPATASEAETSLCSHLPPLVPRASLSMPIGPELVCIPVPSGVEQRVE